MMDTLAVVAALVGDHEHHALARPHLRAGEPLARVCSPRPSRSRGFGQSAAAAAAVLHPWIGRPESVLPTSPAAVRRIFARAAEVCREHGTRLHTLDGRQHRLALALGAESRYLLA